MIWEAALWCGLALAGATGIPRLTRWLGQRLGGGADEAALPLAWLHLVPLYLALITGAVSGRDAGLYGQEAVRWVSGGLACALAFGLAAALLWWRAPTTVWPPVWTALSDEARWALYRAAGALWTGHVLGGAGVGCLLACLEWWVQAEPWGRPRRSIAWLDLSRPLASSLLFALTANAWLTAAAHLALLALSRRLARSEAA